MTPRYDLAVSTTPDLNALFDRKVESMTRFRSEQWTVWVLVDAAYGACDMLLKTVVDLPNLKTTEYHRAMMWWTMLEYQMEGFFLALDKRLDESYAMLRMASELARDIARIGDDEELHKLWLQRGRPEMKKRWSRISKFNDSDASEAMAHKVYDLSSVMGIHGHTTKTMAIRPRSARGGDKPVALDIPDVEIFKQIEIWLMAFFSLHDICVRTYSGRIDSGFAKAREVFAKTWSLCIPVIAKYREGVKQAVEDAGRQMPHH
jgi:hypothetical protein